MVENMKNKKMNSIKAYITLNYYKVLVSNSHSNNLSGSQFKQAGRYCECSQLGRYQWQQRTPVDTGRRMDAHQFVCYARRQADQTEC